MNSITVLPSDPNDRKRLIKKVVIGAGVATGVIVAAVVIRKLDTIESAALNLVAISNELVFSTDHVADAVEAVLP